MLVKLGNKLPKNPIDSCFFELYANPERFFGIFNNFFLSLVGKYLALIFLKLDGVVMIFIRKLMTIFFGWVLLIFLSCGIAGDYLQASSSVTQTANTSPTVVTMDMVDAKKGVTLDRDGSITIKTAGAYFIVAAPQVGRAGKGSYGCFDLWLRVNGEDVDNSNVQLCNDKGSKAKDVIVSQSILYLEEDDVVKLMMSIDNTVYYL